MNKTSPKDIFMHLLSIVTLYASATSFLILAFQYINVQLPDVLQYYYYSGALDMMRGAIAALIVVFPVYLFSMRTLRKEYSRDTEKREARIRKWLVYFTLFIAALIIIGDLVSLLYTFLQGDITVRFLLKTLAVFVTAGMVFSFYIWDLKNKAIGAKPFAYIASAIVIIAIIFGFLSVGSPMSERVRKFDDRRTQDLQTIQSEIVYYWQNKGKLPVSLSVMNDDLRGFTVPEDPDSKSGNIYEYKITGIKNFELCATFSLPSRNYESGEIQQPRGYGIDNIWTHKEGRTCFVRTIDEDYFKLRPTVD
ncbi:MAG: DUF5671 domain-containing protein [Candidatus Jorgensenbacteria bacterium]|nr:DUF5671 domain-containing protein [Candidatus Jorgensenbacteria bacterium]